MNIIARIIVTSFALLLVAEFLPGIRIDGLAPAILAAMVLGILNAIVRPILVILTLPITVLTLGLFIFVINALLFLFVASFIDGFYVAGFWTALFGSMLVSIVSAVVNKFVK